MKELFLSFGVMFCGIVLLMCHAFFCLLPWQPLLHWYWFIWSTCPSSLLHWFVLLIYLFILFFWCADPCLSMSFANVLIMFELCLVVSLSDFFVFNKLPVVSAFGPLFTSPQNPDKQDLVQWKSAVFAFFVILKPYTHQTHGHCCIADPFFLYVRSSASSWSTSEIDQDIRATSIVCRVTDYDSFYCSSVRFYRQCNIRKECFRLHQTDIVHLFMFYCGFVSRCRLMQSCFRETNNRGAAQWLSG